LQIAIQNFISQFQHFSLFTYRCPNSGHYHHSALAHFTDREETQPNL